eukprot:536330-Amphidinium_carterae.4
MRHKGGGGLVTEGPVHRGPMDQIDWKIVWFTLPVSAQQDGLFAKAGNRAHDLQQHLPIFLRSLLVIGGVAVHIVNVEATLIGQDLVGPRLSSLEHLPLGSLEFTLSSLESTLSSLESTLSSLSPPYPELTGVHSELTGGPL